MNLLNGAREVRDEFVEKVEILDKVKMLSLLPDGEHMTLRQVSEYYEIDIEVTRKTIQRHRNELISDGMKKLSGRQLTEFKKNLPFAVPELHKVPSTQLLPRRAILRMGMVLKSSKVAETVRTYLLEAEKLITIEQKKIIFQGSWTEEIDDYIIQKVTNDNVNKIRLHETLESLSKEINASVHQIKNYWYTGAGGKTALRKRVNLRVITTQTTNNKTGEEEVKSMQTSGYTDLFDFQSKEEQVKINEANQVKIKELQKQVDDMQVSQAQVIKSNNELLDMMAKLMDKLKD